MRCEAQIARFWLLRAVFPRAYARIPKPVSIGVESVWMGESKPDTPYRIRVDANIKYAVSAYPDSCGRGLKRSRNFTPLQERMQKLWAPLYSLSQMD